MRSKGTSIKRYAGDPYWNNVISYYRGSMTAGSFGNLSPVAASAYFTTRSCVEDTGTYIFGNSSMSFNGSNQALGGNNPSYFNFSNFDFTAEMWFRLNAVNANPHLMVNYQSGSTNRWILWLPNRNSIQLLKYVGGTYTTLMTISGIGDNTWYHVALSYTVSNTTSRLYLNGAQIGQSTESLPTNLELFWVGYDPISGSAQYRLGGYVDELRLTRGAARYTGGFFTQTAEFPITTFGILTT